MDNRTSPKPIPRPELLCDVGAETRRCLKSMRDAIDQLLDLPEVCRARQDHRFEWHTNGVLRMYLAWDGGFVVCDGNGADPTGGSMGPGTINVAGSVNVDGVALT